MATFTKTADSRTDVRQPSPATDPLRGFRQCYEVLIASIAFVNLRWYERRCPMATRKAFLRSWEQLTSAGTTDVAAMVRGAYLAAADDRTREGLIDMAKLAKKETRKLLRDAPPLPGNTKEIIAAANRLPGPERYRCYSRALEALGTAVILRFQFALNQLHEAGLAGTAQFDSRECVFSYGRSVFCDVERDRTEDSSEKTRDKSGMFLNKKIRTTTVRTERTVETTTSLQTVRHHLRYPERHPVGDPRVQAPDRVRSLASCLKPWMRPQYITGELVAHSVDEESLGSRKDKVVEVTQHSQVTRHINRDTLARAGAVAGFTALTAATIVVAPLIAAGFLTHVMVEDPALVVGDGTFVLSGWLPEEVPIHRRYRIERD